MIIESHNEWDPLKKVVLGDVHGARFPKYDDVFNEEDKKEVIQMIEKDTYEMRKQRILSGIKKDIKNNFKIYNSIFGIEQKEVA